MGSLADRLEALRSELARPGLEIECHAVDLAGVLGVEPCAELMMKLRVMSAAIPSPMDALTSA